LAFVATLAWDGFNKAKAASHLEAALVMDVTAAADGLAEPVRANLLDSMTRYTKTVIAIEWPAQAEGHLTRAGDRFLDDVQRLVVSLKPASQADTNLHALLLESLARLRDAATHSGATFASQQPHSTTSCRGFKTAASAKLVSVIFDHQYLPAREGRVTTR
jgi:hypothetical protein